MKTTMRTLKLNIDVLKSEIEYLEKKQKETRGQIKALALRLTKASDYDMRHTVDLLNNQVNDLKILGELKESRKIELNDLEVIKKMMEDDLKILEKVRADQKAK